MADKNLLPGWEPFQTDEGEWTHLCPSAALRDP